MRKLKFFLEIAVFMAVVPVLVFAKLNHSNKRQLQATVNQVVSIEQPAPTVELSTTFPGLINSQFIIIED